jgi:hypothetical protein
MLIEIVGDIVRMIDGFPVVPAFPYFGGAPRNMTVSDRTTLAVNERQ